MTKFSSHLNIDSHVSPAEIYVSEWFHHAKKITHTHAQKPSPKSGHVRTNIFSKHVY